jgi:uncharacterized protein YuzE
VVAPGDLRALAELARLMRRLPTGRMSASYDAEADVLYVRFGGSTPIHRSDLTKEDVLIEYDSQGQVVGVTILEASTREEPAADNGRGA